jgi:hypothetical protein
MRLFSGKNDAIIDVFGETNVDVLVAPWEYQDGCPNRRSFLATFDLILTFSSPERA